MRITTKALLIGGGLAGVCCWLVRSRFPRNVDCDKAADIVDETLLEADPDVVYKAVVDEHDGKTNWWAPHYSMELLEGDSYGDVGTLLGNTVRVHGRFPIRFITKTVEVERNKEIRVDYVGGAFRGEALWKFEAVNEKTCLSLQWRTTPSGVLRALALLLPIEQSHSDTMKVGFEGLSAYLSQPPSPTGE